MFFELFLLPFKSVSLAWNTELYLYPSVPIDVLVAKSRSILMAPWIVAHQAPLSWGFSRHARILEWGRSDIRKVRNVCVVWGR